MEKIAEQPAKTGEKLPIVGHCRLDLRRPRPPGRSLSAAFQLLGSEFHFWVCFRALRHVVKIRDPTLKSDMALKGSGSRLAGKTCLRQKGWRRGPISRRLDKRGK
jgi:hypothetical protein